MIEPVQFFMPAVRDLEGFDDIDPDREWHLLSAGKYQTVGQTYLRLKAAGLPVVATNVAPSHGIVVTFAPDLRTLLASRFRRASTTLVCVLADRPVRELPHADVVVRHNGAFVDNKRTFFIPNWVQGGLIQRDSARGSKIENVVYKGRREHLHPWFTSSQWERDLAERGVRFRAETEGELRSDHTYAAGAMRWNDYRDVDVSLAVRPRISDPHAIKPAVKLVNSWFAGVPALLGPEHAYREQRRSELDYIEVDSYRSALAAVDQLLADPGFYAAMVENGRARQEEFTSSATLAKWERLLFDRLQEWRPARLSRVARPLTAPILRARLGLRHRMMDLRDDYRRQGRSGSEPS